MMKAAGNEVKDEVRFSVRNHRLLQVPDRCTKAGVQEHRKKTNEGAKREKVEANLFTKCC